MTYPVIRNENRETLKITDALLGEMTHLLRENGYVLLRNFDVDMAAFSATIQALCSNVTFDPARAYSAQNVQKVDAGTDAVGMHIENGNTPFPPDLVSFFCAKGAVEGSQTTVCDGAKVFDQLTAQQRQTWSRPIIMTRNLPEVVWKRYVATEHPAIECEEHVTEDHLSQILRAVPGQSGTLGDDGTLRYGLTINPVIRSKLSPHAAFANAILGPSFNYEAPHYQFENGSVLSDDQVTDIATLVERNTHEINWQDGDVIVIDNKRVMHGRRAIIDADRQLFIGMGSL